MDLFFYSENSLCAMSANVLSSGGTVAILFKQSQIHVVVSETHLEESVKVLHHFLVIDGFALHTSNILLSRSWHESRSSSRSRSNDGNRLWDHFSIGVARLLRFVDDGCCCRR